MNSKTFRGSAKAANDPDYGVRDLSGISSDQARRTWVETLDRLLDQVASDTLKALGAAPPGSQRQWRGIEAHLDACLKRPDIPVLTRHLLGQAGDARRRQRLTRLADLLCLAGPGKAGEAAGREPHTLAAMVLEAEQAEQEQGRSRAEYRTVLRSYLGVGPQRRLG